jgi:hypothetical protein
MPTTSPIATSFGAMALNGAGKVVLLDTGNYPEQSNYLNTVATWAATAAGAGNGNWTITNANFNSQPLPLRSDYILSYDGSQIVMGFGQGQSAAQGICYDYWLYSNTGVWTQGTGTVAAGTAPFGITKAKAAYLPGTGAVMFGGSNIINCLATTFVESGGAWTQIFSTNSPSARIGHCMAGGTGATAVYLYGGGACDSDQTFGDLWKYASGQWTQLTPTNTQANSPPYLVNAAMAYDQTHNTLVLFGGATQGGLLSPPTSWIYNITTNTWSSVVMPNGTGPAARIGHMMAWDSYQVLMFGGEGSAENVFNDSWGWNGTTWVQL